MPWPRYFKNIGQQYSPLFANGNLKYFPECRVFCFRNLFGRCLGIFEKCPYLLGVDSVAVQMHVPICSGVGGTV